MQGASFVFQFLLTSILKLDTRKWTFTTMVVLLKSKQQIYFTNATQFNKQSQTGVECA